MGQKFKHLHAMKITTFALFFLKKNAFCVSQYMLSLVDSQYDRLGWRDEGSHAQRLQRVIVLSLACRNGHQASDPELPEELQRNVLK